MRFPHANITAHKRGKRNGLRSGKGRIPPGTVLNARNLLAILVLVGSRRLVLDELCAALWMLALAQVSESICLDSTVESPFLRKLTAPFAVCLPIAAPVVLLLGGEFARVVCLCLFG
jgi:hypothetical protein